MLWVSERRGWWFHRFEESQKTPHVKIGDSYPAARQFLFHPAFSSVSSCFALIVCLFDDFYVAIFNEVKFRFHFSNLSIIFYKFFLSLHYIFYDILYDSFYWIAVCSVCTLLPGNTKEQIVGKRKENNTKNRFKNIVNAINRMPTKSGLVT